MFFLRDCFWFLYFFVFKKHYFSNFIYIFSASLSSFVGNRPSEPITVVNDPNDLDPSPVRNQNVLRAIYRIFVFIILISLFFSGCECWNCFR